MEILLFDTIDSTQTAIMKELEKNPEKDYLAIAKEQSKGRGRRGSTWDNFSKSLLMSFTLAPSVVPTLTSLEVGIAMANAFDLQLKWPNDLFNINGEKVGGILIESSSLTNQLIVGVGINYGECLKDPTGYPYPISSLAYRNVEESFEQERVIELVKKMKEDRPTCSQIKDEFNRLCFHRNSQVKIITDRESISGKFLGIGTMGEAIIKTEDGQTKDFFSGSLRLV